MRRHAAFTPLAVIRARDSVLFNDAWGLAQGLARDEANVLKLSRGAIEERLRNDPAGLLSEIAEADKSAEMGKRTVLIGLDQAEEIAALSPEEDADLTKLLDLVAKPPEGLDLRLALTVRDDSIDAVIERLEKARISQDVVETWRLHRLPAARFPSIISGPANAAKRAGWPLSLSDELIEALAGAAAASQSEGGDALPILAIALQRLVKKHRAPGGGVDLPAERAAAFLEDAIANAAEEARREAGATEEDLRRLVIPQLATWDPRAGEGGAAKRQVAVSGPLFAGDRAALKGLADALVAQRLLTRSGAEQGARYEVAHEALLRVAPLGDMIFELKEKFIRADLLTFSARDWRSNGEIPDFVAHTGERLAAAKALVADADFGALFTGEALGMSAYLAACDEKDQEETRRRDALARAEAAAAEQRAQAEAERAKAAAEQAKAEADRADAAERVAKASRWNQRLAMLATLVFAVIAGVAGWYYQQSERNALAAREASVEATENAQIAEAEAVRADKEAARARGERNAALLAQSRYLAGFADRETARDNHVDAMALALEALPRDLSNTEGARPYSPEAFRALSNARHGHRESLALRGHESWVNERRFLPRRDLDRHRLLRTIPRVSGTRRAARRSWRCAAMRTRSIAPLSPPTGPGSSPALWTRPRVSGTRRAARRSWRCAAMRARSLSAAFSPDGTRIVTGSLFGPVTTAPRVSGTRRAARRSWRCVAMRAGSRSAVFSPDGTRIVTGS